MTRKENYQTCYEILGIKPDCTWSQLRAAYRRAVHTWHPDRFQDRPQELAKAEEKIKEINHAFHILAEYYQKYGVLPSKPINTTGPATISRPYRGPSQGAAHRRKSRTSYSSAPTIRQTSSKSYRAALLLIFSIVLGYAVFGWEPFFLETESTIDPGHPVQGWSGNTQDPLSKEANKPVGFTFGSTMGEVLNAQGPPSRAQGDIWHYGNSRVFFENGVVVSWESSLSDPLRTFINAHFTHGSTMAEVRKVQGEPLYETENVWMYRISKVYFEDGRVISWYNSVFDPLRVKE